MSPSERIEWLERLLEASEGLRHGKGVRMRPCVYCGRDTRGRPLGVPACPSHADLPELDPLFSEAP